MNKLCRDENISRRSLFDPETSMSKEEEQGKQGNDRMKRISKSLEKASAIPDHKTDIQPVETNSPIKYINVYPPAWLFIHPHEKKESRLSLLCLAGNYFRPEAYRQKKIPSGQAVVYMYYFYYYYYYNYCYNRNLCPHVRTCMKWTGK